MEQSIKIITKFIFVGHKPTKKGLLIVPGTHRVNIISKAFEIYKLGLAENIITTGGVFKNNQPLCESEFQKKYLIEKCVSKDIIYSENKSTNTKENAEFALKIAKKLNLNTKRIILVSKTYHARRMLMTYKKVFPNSKIEIVPITDDRNITPENWYKSKKKRDKIFEEIEKIGKYFRKGDLAI